MKKIIARMLCVAFMITFSSGVIFALDASSLKGQKMYTRTNLMREGKIIYFHNMSQSKSYFPVGTEVVISEGTGWGNQIMFKLTRNGWPYVMYVPPQEYEKYFVPDVNEIGLQNFNSDMMANIKNMVVMPGMTKKEVYISRGCPAYIGYGVKSWGHSLDEVMASDSWYYNRTTRKIEMLVMFKDGIVTEISSYLKNQKS